MRFPLALSIIWLVASLSILTAQTDTVATSLVFARETLHVGSKTMDAEIADTPEKGERGLMFREHLGDNQGMIFVLPIGQATFWMKDTLIPLSVAFLDKNGVILEIHDMKPRDETITSSESRAVAFALEANLHWFSLNGIKPGDRVDPVPAPLANSISN